MGTKPHCFRVLAFAMRRLRGESTKIAWSALGSDTPVPGTPQQPASPMASSFTLTPNKPQDSGGGGKFKPLASDPVPVPTVLSPAPKNLIPAFGFAFSSTTSMPPSDTSESLTPPDDAASAEAEWGLPVNVKKKNVRKAKPSSGLWGAVGLAPKNQEKGDSIGEGQLEVGSSAFRK
ncbi:hypothetical protein P691DRAFT_585490 [Macrolepiota fuliginosa MF-IS2]|uniref:Uncharacterized protein n=1 Tax=Macrolepiota fuliginosa MF-IS2 TaxID=1400762 RepID=A0A9P5X1E7_9AGAR|nr:hypothetical protein P691DRAFT_536486 [Macrolepiota fuliginosa MF-IS2]KAF9449062.1 hypothetical protein P691DRAFT_585490 [Macrolepiota fuliginosa MF-IS2]